MTIVLAILFIAWFAISAWAGFLSNGMTSPRGAFNLWLPLFGLLLGFGIGIISLIFGVAGINVLYGTLVGLAAGYSGVGVARWRRGGW
jgi:hypothetical protein